ncbi:MAG: FtsX-like permease family protein [Treponema sp.]|jgi:ABC-type lipoprotein release transport system permease subunit|nr:FtsX-like permease family protein [Treponema sp.]
MKLSTIIELKRMAFRNLSRHRVKTVLTVMAIAVSVAVYIFVDGWLVGMNLESRRNIVIYEMGAAKFQTKAYFEKQDERPMYENFADWQKYADALDKAGYDSAPRFVFTGILYSETSSAPIEFNAVDPSADQNLLRYASYVESGRFIKNGEFAIVLGNVTADKLKVGIQQRPTQLDLEELSAETSDPSFVLGLYEPIQQSGGGMFAPKETAPAPGNGRFALKKGVSQADLDKYWMLLDETGRNNTILSIVIDIKDETGKIRHVNQLIPVKVVGLINSPNPKTNNNIAWIPMDVLQDDAGLMLDGHITELLIRKKNADDAAIPGKDESAPAITQALQTVLGDLLPEDLAVFGWQGYAQNYLATASGDDWSSRIMVIILFILSFLGIANTMLLSILERTKEIGMMRAQGMTDGELIVMYMLEAGMAGFFGAVFGVIAGCLINIPMVKYGIDFSVMTESLGGNIGYRVNGAFRSAWNIPVIIGCPLAAIALSAVMALFPTRRSLKMPVTESLRFE